MSIHLTADLIEIGLMLASLLLTAAIFRKRVQTGWLLASIGAILVGAVAITEGFGLIPEPAIFDRLRFGWFVFALLGAVSLAMIAAIPNGWQRAGLTLAQNGPGVRAALIVSLAVCALITWMGTQDIFGAPRFSLEPLLYNALAVGPAEELFFRGVIFALVLEAFGARKVMLSAEMNWGMIPAALVFGFAHFTSTPGGEEIAFNYFPTLWTTLGGFILAWLRQASGSLLLPYVVHVYGNNIHYLV
jgi:membrane protease YdiL (CAAX protease family)